MVVERKTSSRLIWARKRDRSISLIPTRHNMMSSLKTVSIGPVRADNSVSNSHATSPRHSVNNHQLPS